MMTDEIVRALRICATHEEKGCGLCPQRMFVRCTERLADEAIALIERDQKEIDELRKELEQERRWRQTAQQWRDRDCGRCRLMLGCEYFKYAGVLKDQELEPWMQAMILKKECRKNLIKPNAAGAAK